MSGQRGMIGRNSLAKFDTLSCRYPEEICGAPDDTVLIFIHSAVSIDDFPHHLNDLATAFVVRELMELTGKMIEVYGGPIDLSRFLDQLGGSEIA